MTRPSRPKHPSKRREYAARYAKYHRNGYRAQVSALGTQRRIQALCAIGYTLREQAPMYGISEVYIRQIANGRRSQRLDRRLAQKVAEAYRLLCVQPLHNGYTAKRARTNAKAHGWMPPMAWDDIDDPNEKPSRYAHGRDRSRETARRRELRRESKERQQQEAAAAQAQ